MNIETEQHEQRMGKMAVASVLVAAFSAGLAVVSMSMTASEPLPSNHVGVLKYRHQTEVEVCSEVAQRMDWLGNVEERLHDDDDGDNAGQSRIDIITPTHVWEADWSHKWPEAIGQSSYYSIQWNREHPGDKRQPGVLLLLIEPNREQHYVTRCRRVCDQLGITLRTETVRGK
jgi:hypothetical protein